MQIRAFKALLEKYQDYTSNPGAEKPEKTYQRFEVPGTDFWFISLNTMHIGVIRVCDLGELCMLKQIFILPEYRNNGYAREAMRQVETLYPNALRWELDTILQEEKLCRMYEKLGYRKTGKTQPVKDGMSLVFYAKQTKNDL